MWVQTQQNQDQCRKSKRRVGKEKDWDGEREGCGQQKGGPGNGKSNKVGNHAALRSLLGSMVFNHLSLNHNNKPNLIVLAMPHSPNQPPWWGDTEGKEYYPGKRGNTPVDRSSTLVLLWQYLFQQCCCPSQTTKGLTRPDTLYCVYYSNVAESIYETNVVKYAAFIH